MSKTLPWRTLATPSTPSDFSAPSMALPWGSRMPDLSVTVTRAFIFMAQYSGRHPEVPGRSPGLEGRHCISYLHPSRLAQKGLAPQDDGDQLALHQHRAGARGPLVLHQDAQPFCHFGI